MARPNKQRRKLTIYLSEKDRENARELRSLLGIRTESGAIRLALTMTRRSLEQPSAPRDLLVRIADHLESIEFVTPANRRKSIDLILEARRLMRDGNAQPEDERLLTKEKIRAGWGRR